MAAIKQLLITQQETADELRAILADGAEAHGDGSTPGAQALVLEMGIKRLLGQLTGDTDPNEPARDVVHAGHGAPAT